MSAGRDESWWHLESDPLQGDRDARRGVVAELAEEAALLERLEGEVLKGALSPEDARTFARLRDRVRAALDAQTAAGPSGQPGGGHAAAPGEAAAAPAARAAPDVPKATTPGLNFTAVAPDGAHIRGKLYGNPSALDKLLLIMGFAGSLEFWDFQVHGTAAVPPITDRTECQLAVYDNRGAGTSSSPWGLYTTAQLAGDARAVLLRLGWLATGLRLHVAAHSMGGMIAQQLACALTEDGLPPESLLLITSHSGGWRSLPALTSAPRTVRAACCALDRERMVRELLPLLHSPEFCDALVADGTTGAQWLGGFYTDRFPVQGPGSLSALLPGLVGHAAAVAQHHAAPERLGALRGAGVRCAVVLAERDRVIPAQHHIDLALKLGCPLFRLDAGHMVICERPEEVNAIVVQVMRGTLSQFTVPPPPLSAVSVPCVVFQWPAGKAAHALVGLAVGAGRRLGATWEQAAATPLGKVADAGLKAVLQRVEQPLGQVAREAARVAQECGILRGLRR
eukprot:TRINITY_DN24887_c0_g1_i4.p1 TRINITY_DN24887_c0_g1~~TRINITY_DN24887_c0_g1_i4.p1  ORF type:complete len:535 (+),score=142.60 TRINITY_DN24887_c0_g1_i4:80-1606(+)